MPGKRKRSCPFSSSKRRRKKAKKSFNQECAAILAARDRGSYYNQREWLEEAEDHVNKRADGRPDEREPRKNTAK